MRRRILACLLWLTCLPLAAQTANNTADLLTAPFVSDLMELRTVPAEGSKLGLEIRLDDTKGRRGFKVLDDKATFLATDTFDLGLADFNPLVLSPKTTESLVAEDNFGSPKKFLDELLALGKTVFPDVKAATDAMKAADEALRAKHSKGGAPPPKCQPYEDLKAALIGLQNKIKPLDLAADVKGWTQTTVGLEGVTKTRKSIGDRTTDVKANIDAIKALNEKIEALAKGPEAEQKCEDFLASTLAQIYTLSYQVPKAQETFQAQKESLQGLDKALEPFSHDTDWRGEGKKTFVLRKVTPSFANGKEIKVEIGKVSIDSETLTLKSEAAVSRTFTVRERSFIVPELAVALLYNDVAYPKWGTGKDDKGNTVVKAAADEKLTVTGALMLNLVCRCWARASSTPPSSSASATRRTSPAPWSGSACASSGPSASR